MSYPSRYLHRCKELSSRLLPVARILRGYHMSSAKFLPCDDKGFQEAGEMLRSGMCVAFPTETVYGLGANALDEEAVLSVFKYKGRPLTDPLIVHIDSRDGARGLVELDREQVENVFTALTDAFWPGPLTVVLKASDIVPSMITARTGWVGVRIPAHPQAIRLLSAAKVPVAAPSANRFGHVSPTTAAHVFADLGMHPIGIMDGEGMKDTTNIGEFASTATSCEIGIESTVAKISQESDASPVCIDVFRKGGVGISALARTLVQKGYNVIVNDANDANGGEGETLTQNTVVINVVERHSKVETAVSEVPTSTAHKKGSPSSTGGEEATDSTPPHPLVETTEVGEVAPGQLLTHYAPDVPAYLVSAYDTDKSSVQDYITTPGGLDALKETVVLDFGGVVQHWMDQLQKRVSDPVSFLAYRDLSASGSPQEASSNLFAALRWAEEVANAKSILLLDPRVYAQFSKHMAAMEDGACARPKHCEDSTDAMEAIRDRMFRAASGKVVSIRQL